MEGRLKARLHYADYCAIPSDRNRHEIVDGELHVTPSPGPAHQRLVFELACILRGHFRPPAEVFIAPLDVIVTSHDVFVPDIVVVADQSCVSARGVEGAPLLVVEVLSPSTQAHDRTTKSRRYAALAIPHYWIVDGAASRLECYRHEAGAYRLVARGTGDEVLAHADFPGLAIPIAPLFGLA